MAKNYKIVNASTDNGTITGAQLLIAKIEKVDAQGVPNAYIKNVVISAMINEAEDDVGAMMFYLTTDGVWNDDYVISAKASPGPGGTVSLSANRSIRSNDTAEWSDKGTGGPIYIWVEIADYVATESFRWVTEVWGQRHIVTEL